MKVCLAVIITEPAEQLKSWYMSMKYQAGPKLTLKDCAIQMKCVIVWSEVRFAVTFGILSNSIQTNTMVSLTMNSFSMECLVSIILGRLC